MFLASFHCLQVARNILSTISQMYLLLLQCCFIVRYSGKSKKCIFHAIFSFTVTGPYTPDSFTSYSMTPFDVFSPDIPGIPTEDPTEFTTTTTTTITNGDSQERIYNGLNDKLIPIYCSILAAVVVGLVAFIIFKR